VARMNSREDIEQKKTQEKELSRNWGLVVLGSLLAFFVAISANALFSIMHGSDKVWRDAEIFILFGIVSIYFANVIQYMFKNLRTIGNKGITEITKDWMRPRNK